MNRNSYNSEEITEHDDGFSKLGITTEKPEMVVAYDADFLVYFALYAKDGEGNTVEWDITKIEQLQAKLSDIYFNSLISVEKYFKIRSLYTFIRGKDRGFRKDLSPHYKAKRPEKHPLTDILYNWLEVAHGAILSNGGLESDDNCSIIAHKTEGNCIIISNDKDLRQCPCILYNPQKNLWERITPKIAKHHLYMQYICGDSTDGVSGAKKLGISYFNKNFHDNMTNEEYEAALFEGYLKSTKGNKEEALREMELNKQLLTLKTS